MQNQQTIYFGAGCFWCTQSVFAHLTGVISTQVGYMGGHTLNPTYEQICTGETQHAEVLQLVYNPHEISLAELIKLFFATHDYTQLNQQGHDKGTQYRSVIFCSTKNQLQACQQAVLQLKNAGKNIQTEVLLASQFYIAEEEHQFFYEKNPYNGYCRITIEPKLQKRDAILSSS